MHEFAPAVRRLWSYVTVLHDAKRLYSRHVYIAVNHSADLKHRCTNQAANTTLCLFWFPVISIKCLWLHVETAITAPYFDFRSPSVHSCTPRQPYLFWFPVISIKGPWRHTQATITTLIPSHFYQMFKSSDQRHHHTALSVLISDHFKKCSQCHNVAATQRGHLHELFFTSRYRNLHKTVFNFIFIKSSHCHKHATNTKAEGDVI